jgi:hypothetical protein
MTQSSVLVVVYIRPCSKVSWLSTLRFVHLPFYRTLFLLPHPDLVGSTKSRTFGITISVIVDAELKKELKEVSEFSCCTMKR